MRCPVDNQICVKHLTTQKNNFTCSIFKRTEDKNLFLDGTAKEAMCPIMKKIIMEL